MEAMAPRRVSHSITDKADVGMALTDVRFRGKSRRYNVESAHSVRDADQ
jgi:hypothetical protein